MTGIYYRIAVVSVFLVSSCSSLHRDTKDIGELYAAPDKKIYALVDRVAVNARRNAITEDEVNFRLEISKRKGNITGQALINERNKIIDGMINEIIVEQIADEQTIIVSDEKVENEMKKIMERAKIKDEGSFRKMIESKEKMPFSFWKDQLRLQILAELVMSIAVDFAPPSLDEVRTWYNKNRNTPAMIQVNVKHILIIPRSSSFADEKAANELLNSIRQRAAGGESFESLAAQYSKDPGSASKGGSLGWVFLGALDPYFANQAYGMRRSGELSPVFKSSFGYHIIKFIGRRTAPFEEISGNISSMMAMQSKDEQFKKWIKQRRATSTIYIYLPDYKETSF